MSENSATHNKMTPEGKPSSSFMTTAEKSGDHSIATKSIGMDNTSEDKTTEPGAGPDKQWEATSIMPAAKPSSSLINTSAVK